MALEQLLVAGGDNRFRHLRRQKPLQSAHPLNFGNLLGHALFERSVPFAELDGLRLEMRGLLLYRVVQRP
jgi:hypothetical protein